MENAQDFSYVPLEVPDLKTRDGLLKCNRKPATNIKNDFPYHRYAAHLRSRNELERWERAEKIIAGTHVESLEIKFEEDALRTEFMHLYGELDPSSNAFAKLFATFQEGRTEELHEWMKTESDLNDNPKLSLPKRKVTSKQEFTDQEVTLFDTVKLGATSGKEWFILPRKAVTVDEIIAFGTKPINLADFDPELTLYEGPRVVPPQESCRDDRGIAEKLSVNIYNLICEYPAGIVANQFLYVYKQKFSYYPDFHGLGYNTITDFLVDLNHVVFTQGNGPNNDFVMYPAYVENMIASPMDIMWKIYHKLIILLKFFQGVCKADKLVQFYESIFHVNLPIKAWGFTNADQFVVYLVNNVKWKSDRYVIQPASLFTDAVDCTGHYVVQMTTERERIIAHLRDLKCSKKVGYGRGGEQVFASGISYRNIVSAKHHAFVKMSAKFEEEVDIIKAGHVDSFKVVRFVSANNFDIVRAASTESLRNTYNAKWSYLYKKLNAPGAPGTLVATNALQPGLPVVIYRDDISKCNRGRYMGPDHGSFASMHKVKLVDEGGEVTVHLADIHYMVEAVLTDLRAQAISVGLHGFVIEDGVTKGKMSSTHRMISNYASDLLCPAEGFQFVQVVFEDFDFTKGKWLVTVTNGQGPKTQNVAKELISFCRKHGVGIGGPHSDRLDTDRHQLPRSVPIQVAASNAGVDRSAKLCDSDMNWRSPKSSTNVFQSKENYISDGREHFRHVHEPYSSPPKIFPELRSAWRTPTPTEDRPGGHGSHHNHKTDHYKDQNSNRPCRNPRTPISYVQATSTTRRY